jgi:signal transduction histidine kinase
VDASGVDAVTRRAWQERAPRLLPSLDPVADPNLDALLPRARNVLVVPLLVDRSTGLGIVALEHPGRRGRVKRWVVAIVERFASHAALTLHNAWLRERLERQLEENRVLQRRLVEHNQELEVRVDERTRDLRKSLEDLRVADEQRRRLLAHLVHVEEEERRRIAGDVHDDPVQKMSAATMRIHVLRRTLSDPKQHEIADKVMASVRESIASLRNLIFELRPHALDEEGLGPALREYLESLDAGFEARLDDRLSAQPAAELGVVLYRMAQEALANVRKHARATLVRVSLLEHEGGFLLRIADDGVGFESPSTLRSPKGHLGLTSLRERAEMAGGWCRLDSRPGRGTTVEAWLPGPPAQPGVEVRQEVEDPVGVAGPPVAAAAETAPR